LECVINAITISSSSHHLVIVSHHIRYTKNETSNFLHDINHSPRGLTILLLLAIHDVTRGHKGLSTKLRTEVNVSTRKIQNHKTEATKPTEALTSTAGTMMVADEG
jgi:hypothetical protein